jgi:hypothetical protein
MVNPISDTAAGFNQSYSIPKGEKRNGLRIDIITVTILVTVY